MTWTPPQWYDLAACKGMADLRDANPFFCADEEPHRVKLAKNTEAKRVCGLCPVRGECEGLVAERGWEWAEEGVWHGVSAGARRKAGRAA